jgi:uncharacterized protein YndB with AHSA1/START domain
MPQKNSPTPGSSGREIVTTRVFAAPRELVWNAWTDPKQVAQWWGPDGFTNTIHEMDVRPGGAWRHTMHGPDGVDYKNESIFGEVAKPERLTYSHISGPSFKVTVTFDEHDGKTKVTLRMVFDTAAERDEVAEKYGAVEGARQTLARLGDHLGRIEGTSDTDFVISRVFDAPRGLVWKAWTVPAQMAQWWGPKAFTNPVCEMDVRPGGAYRLTMRSPEGVDYPVKGVFREVVEPERLVMTLDCSEHPPEWHDLVDPKRAKGDTNPAGEMLSTVTFEDADGGTRLTVRTRFSSAKVRDAMLAIGMTEGWSQSLDRLGALLPGG